jgi:acylphosphatase
MIVRPEAESSMEAIRTVRVRVEGRVQGVAYRAWTRDTACGLGLAGWVRNESDGAVSALLSGPPQAVEAMLAAMRQGPEAAIVRTVTTEPADEDAPTGFSIGR